MLIEFIVMHSGAFYAAVAAASASRVQRSLMLTGLTAFYAIFAAFSFAFKSTWPFFAFGWLFVSRFAGLWMREDAVKRELMSSAWGASVVFYLLGVFATIFIHCRHSDSRPTSSRRCICPAADCGSTNHKP